jgi:hypothetical protein
MFSGLPFLFEFAAWVFCECKVLYTLALICNVNSKHKT